MSLFKKIFLQSKIDFPMLFFGTSILLFILFFLLINYSLKHFLLLIIGGALGFVLFHSSFGFTGSWRSFINERKGNGIRSQLLAIGLSMLLIVPFIGNESFFGSIIVGSFGPVGVSVIIGSFLFGLGMQLGGGCGSGTLYNAGAGNTRMLITLIFFILGSLLGTLHLPWWSSLPSFGVISLSSYISTVPTLIIQGILLIIIAMFTIFYEKRGKKNISTIYQKTDTSFFRVFVFGNWPLLWGAIAIALLSIIMIFIAGHTWSVTFALGLWGAKIASHIGIDVSQWEYWKGSYQAQALQRSILTDSVSLTNIGLLLGAFIASNLSGKNNSKINISLLPFFAAILGGILMGYGARLAFGCSIGALFSGIASGSMHGWLWLLFAFAGSYYGIKLRPYFKL